MFFNVVNHDDGQTWSTPWIVDDPSVFYMPKEWTLADLREYREKRKLKDAGAVTKASHQTAARPKNESGSSRMPTKPFVLRR